MGAPVVASVLICTYNRAALLAETLDSLAGMRVPPPLTWEVVVVDNNSADGTAGVVQARQDAFPVPLRYVFEPQQGKSRALNTGLDTITAELIFFTDDDVRVDPGWLEAGAAPMLTDPSIDYTGGPVQPIWGVRPPRWLPVDKSDLWGVIAALDYGSVPFIFEARGRIPLGANMAVRRSLLEAVGGFNPALGRTGESLLGQEQAEFFFRTRRHGARGLYVPAMSVQHHVPARRLTRDYFRRWWYAKGISRARLEEIQGRQEPGTGENAARRVAGVPPYVFGETLRHAARLFRSVLGRDPVRVAEHELAIMYYAGYARESWRRSRSAERRPPGADRDRGGPGRSEEDRKRPAPPRGPDCRSEEPGRALEALEGQRPRVGAHEARHQGGVAPRELASHRAGDCPGDPLVASDANRA